LSEIYALLESKKEDGTPLFEKGAEIVTALKAEFKTKNDEAAKHRTAKNTSEEQLKKVRESLELGDGDDLESALDTVKKLKKEGVKPGDNTEFSRQLKKLEDKIKSVEEARLAEYNKRISEVKKNKALSALKDTISPEDIATLLLPNLDMDGEEVVFKKDGETVKFDDGVKGWLEARPHFVKNPQKPGAGSSGGASGGAVNNPWSKKTLNLTEQAKILKEKPDLAKRLQESAKNEK
jgi:hypothetical protein